MVSVFRFATLIITAWPSPKRSRDIVNLCPFRRVAARTRIAARPRHHLHWSLSFGPQRTCSWQLRLHTGMELIKGMKQTCSIVGIIRRVHRNGDTSLAEKNKTEFDN